MTDINNMNYNEGIAYVKKCIDQNEEENFEVFGGFVVNYPGRINKYDYRLDNISGEAPTHVSLEHLLAKVILDDVARGNQLSKELWLPRYQNALL